MLMQNAVKLCIFFDGAKNSSYLLPWLFSFLNGMRLMAIMNALLLFLIR